MYLKGVRKERRIMKELQMKGFDIVARTAASHSPIDVFGINKKARVITFIQSKPDDYPKSKAKKIHDELDFLNGQWIVMFELI
jgi:Holliday junction resolvase